MDTDMMLRVEGRVENAELPIDTISTPSFCRADMLLLV